MSAALCEWGAADMSIYISAGLDAEPITSHNQWEALPPESLVIRKEDPWERGIEYGPGRGTRVANNIPRNGQGTPEYGLYFGRGLDWSNAGTGHNHSRRKSYVTHNQHQHHVAQRTA